MRLDTVSGHVRWRKFIESTSEMTQFKRTTAMALTPDGSTLAVHVHPEGDNYYHKSMVSCMRTGDGGIISDATIITHGVALSGEHALFSQGMVYKDSNTLFMTFM